MIRSYSLAPGSGTRRKKIMTTLLRQRHVPAYETLLTKSFSRPKRLINML